MINVWANSDNNIACNGDVVLLVKKPYSHMPVEKEARETWRETRARNRQGADRVNMANRAYTDRIVAALNAMEASDAND